MSTNPSHILIARNPRGQPNITSASLSSPTETHPAAAGIFRSSAGSTPWFLEGVDTEDAVSEVSISDSHEPIDIDEAFTKTSKFPGTVKIVVESTTFWCVWPPHPNSSSELTGGEIYLGHTRKSYGSRLRSSRPRWAETGPKPAARSQCPLSSQFLTPR